MSFYQIVFIVTNIIFIYSHYKIQRIFFDEKTCNRKAVNVILSFYFVTLSLTVFANQFPVIMFFTNIAFLGLLSFCYKSSVQKKLLSVSLTYVIGLIIEIISVAAFGLFALEETQSGELNSIPILIFVRVMTLIVSHILSRCKIKFNKNYSILSTYYYAFFAVLFGSLYLFVSQLDNVNLTTTRMLICSAVLIAVNITMIIVDEKIYRGMTAENEKNILIQQTIAYENQIKLVNQSNDKIKYLKHDFKNHLIMLSNLHKNNKHKDFEEYIDQILGSGNNKVFACSNNFVIDSIINYKLSNFDTSTANIILHINIPTKVKITNYDLITITSNLLDNAIEACEKSNEKSNEKVLEIKMSYKMGNLLIVIENSHNLNIIEEEEKLQTTKADKLNHGIGLTSVRNAVEKYNGEMDIKHTKSRFCVSIIIPC